MKRFRNGQGTTFRSSTIVVNSINMNTIIDNPNHHTELIDGIGDGNNSNSNFSMNNSNGGGIVGGGATALVKRRYDMFQMSNSQDSSSFPIPLQSPNDDYSNSVFSTLDNELLGDKLMQPPEEPNYFAEKYAGKVCALCNLGERSQLGQGELLRIELRDNEKIKTPLSSPVEGKDSLFSDKSPRSANALQLHNRRQKGLNKCKNPVMTAEYVNELDKIGYVESLEFSVLHDGGYFYVHRSCAMWSFDIVRESNGALDNISNVVTTSLARKCAYCQRFGASISCKMSCPKYFHYPCVAASGAFQIIQTYSTFCREHLGQVPLVCSDDINCRTCSGLGDVSNLMTCCVCGDNYHGSCIGVAQQPGIRAGWQCSNCRSCQICRVPDSTEGRTVGCEQCDKIYHATCLRPIMATIPKFGWKCRCCRVCSDCGSRSPGAGTSSRWHAHYTVCDSCYQQRNKGFQCPICHRAYRAAALRDMVKCNTCNKFVHSNCDPDAEPNIYHAKRDSNPEYEYVCAPCKSIAQNGRITAAMRRSSTAEEDNMSVSQESLYDDNTMDVDLTEKILPDVGLGKGKPYTASKVAKKRLGLSSNQTGRPKGIGKLAFQKRFKFSDFGRKRNTKSKMRGIFGVPGVGLQKPSSQATDNNTKPEEEPGIENRLVLCSAKDKFVLTQDICVMCGAIGTDQEGCLISCVQCGQCYHPYCVMVKVTKVILQKGWRCLDCTVCEGCGQRNDEARLILCDDCDISYHIYCMDPPLDYVPHGNWKCKWCAICFKCGTNDPGKNSVWMSSYTECGPCSSQSNCPVCSEGYSEGELIIQCTSCDRWLHCGCDAIRNEDDAERCAEDGYTCILCRPRDVLPPHLLPKKITAAPIVINEISKPSITQITTKMSVEDPESGLVLGLDGNHYLDGICLSELGLKHIKSLQLEQNKKKRRPKIPLEANAADKEAGILAAIESVVAGSSLDNSLEDVKFEPLNAKEEAEIYKDGMVWDRADASPPEGFTLCQTEQGIVVLRKRRQRNLQKVGIGGFTVRNRNVNKSSTINKDGIKEECDDASELLPTITESQIITDKKKKPIRKKQKNKLIETYPSYLQEAFFGKSLLETTKPKFESSSSEDEAKSSVSEDKTIKLSMEELKMIEAMRAKQQQQIQQQAQLTPPVSGSDQKHTSINMKPNNSVKEEIMNEMLPPKKEKIDALVEEDSDTDALKDILPNDLLDTDLVNTIMNENDDIAKNAEDLARLTNDTSDMIEDDGRGKNNEFNDLFGSHFNYEPIVMNSKDVEEIFKVVLTDESQESQESSVNANNPKKQPHQIIPPVIVNQQQIVQQQQQHQQSPQQQHLHQQIMVQSNNQNIVLQQQQQQRAIVQTGNPNMMQQMGQQNIVQHHLVQQQQHVGMDIMNQQPQVMQQQQVPQRPQPPMTPQNKIIPQFVESPYQKQIPQSPQWPTSGMMGQGQLMSRMDSVESNISSVSTPGTEDENVNTLAVAQPSYNQKTSERMKHDEVLGDMATISAVLYANINHPELKADFPNWPDRFKQILKKWRALSNEQKAPYLQQSRDNRSQLKMKKAHQVPSPKEVSSKNSSTISIPVTSASPILSDMSSPDGRSQHQIIIGHSNPQQTQVQSQQQLQQHQQQQQQQQQSQQHLVEVQGNSMDGNLEQLTASSLNFNIINNKSSASDNNINNSTITNTPPTTISTTITSNSTITTTNSSSFVNSIHNNNTNASFYNNSCNSLDSTTSELNDSDSKSTNTNSNDNNSCSNSNNNNDNCNSLTATFVKSNNNANISAAANIANSFINLTNLQTGNLITQNTIPANLNVIVSQPITHHFMKTFTIGKVATKSSSSVGTNNIIVPNVIASNLAPQFTLHHQYGLHTNTNGPAPNVTVNPNGNFQTNPNSVLRPTFRPIFQPNQTVNLNIIGTNNNVAGKSPILAAQLQTITQMASNQLQQQQQQQMNATVNKTTTLHYQLTQQSLNETQNILAVKITSPPVVESSAAVGSSSAATTTSRSQSPFSYSPQPPKTPSTPSTPRSLTPHQSNNNNNNNLNNNDQQIRVLTPSEIMRTLPSLPNQDVDCCFENTNHATNTSTTIIKNNPININLNNNNNSNVSNCSQQQQQQQLPKTINTIINSNSNTQVISSTAININPTSQCVFSTTDPSQINTNSTIITTSTSNALSTDQEKITAQQKSLREQEQERQWKQLQVMRAREQQLQQLVLHEQRTQDPTMQLQISTNNNNYSIGPVSPSPNSRGTPFVAPANKGRIGGTAQSPTTYHSGKQMRPVQIARGGALQQNMTSNPFSPQSQTPLSPLDQQFPGSPATQTQIDPFSRPSSENSQPDSFIQHSPQSARSFGQQSPNPAQNRSPAYVSQANSQVINNSSNSVRLNMDSGGYVQTPGTPRPQFSTGNSRPTVYARPGELFDNSQSSPFTSPRNDMFQAQQQQQQQMQVQSDRNRQLRDLLQRQQPPSSPICTNQQQMMNQNSSPTPPPRWNGGTEIEDNQSTIPNSPNQTQSDITFRQPLPPSMILRPRLALSNPGGKIIRTNQLLQPVGQNQIGNPRGVAIGADVRQRIIRPGSVMLPGKQIITQQSPGGGPPQQFIISNTGQRMPINININRTITPEQFNQSIQSNQQQQQLIQQNIQTGGPNVAFINQRGGGDEMQSVETKEQTIQQATTIIDNSIRNQAQSNQSNISGPGETVESNEIPDNVTAELEKLEQEEGSGIGEVEGVGDILGGLDEDDDDLLVSLTAEMGVHFNILEYADPELDTLNDGEKANLLDSLELDDGESDKDDKKKELEEKNDATGNQQRPHAGELNKNTMQMAGGEIQHGQHQAVSQAMQLQQPNTVITTQQVVLGRNQHGGMHPSILHSSGKLSSLQQQTGSQLIINSSNQQEPNQFQHINRIKTIQMISTQQQMQPGMQQSQQQQLQHHIQHMQQQGQLNAPIGKTLPIRTQLLSKDGTIGIVSGNNAGSFQGIINRGGNLQTVAGVPQRFQQIRITNPQGLQQQTIIHQGSRMMLQQQQQQLNSGQQTTQQGHRMVGIVNSGNQQQTSNQSQPPPPPPPYPGPPPPYPGTVSSNTSQYYPCQTSGFITAGTYQKPQRRPLLLQEQPLLLEDLLEQEKREQERQMISSTTQSQQQQHHPNEMSGMQTPNQNMMGEQGFERLKVDVLNNQPQGVPAQGLLPIKQNQVIVNQINPNATMVGGIRHQFMPRGVNQQHWRGAIPNPQTNTSNISGIQQQNQEVVTTTSTTNNFQVYNANLLPPPQLPPENIVTEQDRQIQLVYEQWLNNQNTVLSNQLKYYETEVQKLRKVRKSLNSKQRQLKKNGNVLTEPDAAELTKITQEQTFYQKHLDSARKQARQHSLVMQDYKTKQQAKLQQIVSPSQHSNSSPAQIAPPSPMAASPNPAQQHLLLHTSQSPITNSIMQPTQSPLQSPSPMMPSQSPGPQNPNVIMQSPGNPQSNSGMSPYSSAMQQSPRIGTPHSQNDEGPFSPTGSIGPSVSPSIPGRMQSPSPRITSPQNRMPGPQAMQGGRIIQTSPIMIQGLQQQQQQNRFIRPQSLVGDQGIRPRLVQQQQQQGNIRAHPGYNSPLGSPQSNQQVSLEHMQNQRMLLVQQRHRQQQLYQHQQQQQQFLQQQQLQQHHQQQQQQQQQMTQNSPIHQQSPSPMLQPQQNSNSSTSPMPPRSPMVHYNLNQPPSSPMVIGGSPLMRRPPSTGGGLINSPANPDRPHSVESSPRSSFMHHSMNDDQMNADHLNQGGGGGGHGPIPFVSSQFYSRIKPGLRGGAPIWGRGAKRLPAPTMSSLIKESQQKEFEENEQMKREFHLAKVSILKKKTGPSVQVSKHQNIPSTSGLSQKKMDLDDIVVIDSSPDEKQRIMDYDDDNDKALVATEVSLSSVAQHGSEVDDISVIESFQTTEFADIVSSPLESSEVENEYVLFASDVVVDYVDSDDSQKNVTKTAHTTSSDDDKNIHVINLNMSSPEGGNEANNSSDDDLKDKLMKGTGYLNSPSGDHHYTSREEHILSMDPEIVIIDAPIKSPEEHNIATAEDFEAMIDCGNSKDGKDILCLNEKAEISNKSSPPIITATFSNTLPPTVTLSTSTSQAQHILQSHAMSSANSSSVIQQPSKNNEPKIIQIVTQNSSTNFGNSKGTNPIMTYATRIPLSAAMIQTRPGMSQVSLATHKKLVKDSQQTTAKVSIGNTTISVPVLKTVPLQSNNQGMSKMDSQLHKSISLNLSKAPTVINVGSQKSIFTLTTFNLTQPSSNARFVQAINRSSPPVNTSTAITSVVSAPSSSTMLYSNNSGQNQIILSKSDNIRDKLSPKPSSSTMSYSKLSSLTVTQDVLLPTKIFEDESISPDSSIEHDENDIIASEKMESLEKELQDKTNQVLKEESKKIENAAGVEKKEKEQLALALAQGNVPPTTPPLNSSLNEKSGKTGVIPVHVIMKSRESSRSPSLPPNQQQRLMSSLPQLSPLSQPNEMITNMASVPQQLRSIMSSVNSSNQGTGGNTNPSMTPANSTAPLNSGSGESQVNYENILPTTKLENVLSKVDEKPSPKETIGPTNPASGSTAPSTASAQTENVTSSHTVTTTSPPATTPTAPQFVLHPTTNPSKIISAQLLTPSSVSPTSTNILVLKQLRTTSSPALMSQTLTSASQQKHSFKSGTQSTIIALPQPSGSSTQGEHKFQFITTQLPNLTKIQPDIKEGKMPSSNIILNNALSSGAASSSSTSSSALPPPALIVTTSRPGVISGNIPQSTTLTLVSSAQTMTTISGSILGATLSQPSTKFNANTLLHNQLTNSPFRRSKSTDEVPVFMKEPQPPKVISSKRHSLEASAVKPEPIDAADDNHVSSTSSTIPKTDLSGSSSNVSGCKFSNIQSNPPTKSEDSQNVLLKQLLQSSGSSTSNTPSPTSPAISTRPVTSLRAPSLGLVSSLEAQLARPVIPLVPPSPLSAISSTGSITANQNSMLNKMAEYSETTTTNVTTVTTTPITTTHRIVSRETSFVSKPVITPIESAAVNRPKTPQQNTTSKMDDNSRKSVSTPPVTSYQSVVVTSPQHSVTSTPPISSTPSPVNVVKTNMMPQILQLQQQHSTSSPPPPYPGKSSSAIPVTAKEASQQSITTQEQQQQQQHDSFTQQMNEIKKEIMDETSQQSMMSDQNGSSSNNKPDSVTPKEELNDSMEMDQQQLLITQSSSITSAPTSNKNINLDPAIEMKRKKRREYQKQRRQMQIMNKELLNNTPKTKKSRKLSKIDEDYDTFIDNLMGQMRQLPSLQILEPLLSKNYNVCPIYGSGDFSKLNLGYNSDGENGSELKGKFGYAEQSNISDFYNTKPFGFKMAQSDLIPQSTQRGFYDQEFPPIKIETDDEKYRYDMSLKERDIGTPDTIISTSSPECGKWELTQHDLYNFPGLRLIKDENNVDEEALISRSMSPQIPIIVPVPIRLKTGISLTADKSFDNKENERVCDVIGNSQSKFGPPTPKDNNVTVTLTLTSSAAEDILGVLKDLASILNIPPPSTYQIVERTTTPPSQKLGLYRTKGKDGKEGVPIDIQTILNGAAKFCRHCDVVILNSMIRAKSSEFPLLALNNNNANGDIINESEDLYFCSKVCYKQFQWRPTSILDEEKQNKMFITSNLEFPMGVSIKSPVMNESTNSIENDRQPNSSSSTTLKELLIKQEVRDDVEHQIKRKLESEAIDFGQPPLKLHKGSRYKYFTPDSFNSTAISKYKKPTDKELTEMLFRLSVTVTPGPKLPEDTRRCIFCYSVGDGVADGPSRLLNFDVDKWVHLNCALWSDGVYETENGALMQLEAALQASLSQACIFCSNLGATLKCFKPRCGNIYHLSCAMKDSVVFYKNKSIMCASHAPKTEKDNELTTLSVERRVYVERDESRQVASVMHYSELSNLMRVGSLIFLNVGQLLPHQLQTFHNQNYIYPNGYKIIRFYWSMRRPNKRCRYICSIVDVSGRPEFRVLVKESSEEDIELRDSSARSVWQRILEPLSKLRKDSSLIQIFPKYVSGEDLFGLSEPAIVRILESLPGIETLTDYKFKYGRNPLLELPLAINPSGAARTEAKLKATLGYHKKPHTQRTGSASQRPAFVPTNSMVGEVACPYSKQFVHSKSSQYKKMKQEWRNNVFLARSKIQGLGLYAARDLEKHTMVIEYIGEVIRTELSELREKQYEARNRGIYMFRLDEERVVDATLSGGLARYINHSCNPNCVTEIVEVDREVRIIIFAKRRINRGEELSYDYKFDIEDDANKISCMCGAPNCRKWMN